MKIAIHHSSGSFSDRWIEYCKREGIEYKIVNAYDSDIVKQVEDCTREIGCKLKERFINR